ncbi:isochorismatase family protein [Streptomyces sp. NPDC002671]
MTTSLRVEPYDLPTGSDLPTGGVDWRVSPDRAVLLIHDMQNYFLEPLGQEMRSRLVDNTAALRKRCVDSGMRVAYTAQPGRMSEEDRGLLRDFWGPGMTSSAADRSIVAELAPEAADWNLLKWRYSAFFRTDLLQRMRAEGRDQLVITGVYGHIGILTTALEAYSNDIRVFLVGDAIGDFSAADHRMTLRHAARCCAKVTDVDGLLT